MDVVSDRDEQFRQFQAEEIRRQTVALESISRNSVTIKALMLTMIILFFVSVVLAVILVGTSS
jgi:hypothetical protein